MKTVIGDALRMLVPLPNDRHGPLSPLLLSLTFLTGLVDAFSYLSLGHVFVANMTGNVVFLAFALAAFSVGAVAGAVFTSLGAAAAGAALAAQRQTLSALQMRALQHSFITGLHAAFIVCAVLAAVGVVTALIRSDDRKASNV